MLRLPRLHRPEESIMKLKPIDQQTIVITGGTSGIGLATARRAAEACAQVVLVARDEDALDNVCSEIRADGGRADYVAAAVGVRGQGRNVVEDRKSGVEGRGEAGSV